MHMQTNRKRGRLLKREAETDLGNAINNLVSELSGHPPNGNKQLCLMTNYHLLLLLAIGCRRHIDMPLMNGDNDNEAKGKVLPFSLPLPSIRN